MRDDIVKVIKKAEKDLELANTAGDTKAGVYFGDRAKGIYLRAILEELVALRADLAKRE